MKAFQRILAVLLCLVMSLGMISMVASAETTDTIDITAKGSLTIHKYEYNRPQDEAATNGTGASTDTVPNDAKGLNGVTFKVTKVEDVSYYAYNDNDTLTLAEAQSIAANVAGTEYTTQTVAIDGVETDGIIRITDMELGIYLVQEISAPAQITGKTPDFLVSIPMTTTDGADWLYDVHVFPKNSSTYAGVTLKKQGRVGNETASDLTGTTATFILQVKNDKGEWETVCTNNKNEPLNGQKITADNDGSILTTDTSTGKVTVSNLAPGEYRFVETSVGGGYIMDGVTTYNFKIANGTEKITVNDKEQTVPAGSVIINGSVVDTNQYPITVINEKPDMKKEIADDSTKDNGTDEDNAGVGDTVQYKVTIDVPSNITRLKTFTLTDTPTNLNDTNSTIVITCPDAEEGKTVLTKGTHYTVSDDTANGFTITFVPSAMGDYAGKQLVVTYNAVVLADAATTGKAPNTIDLTYSNKIKPNTDTTPEGEGDKNHIEDSAIVYTYKIQVEKRLDSAAGQKAAGVEFELYEGSSNDPIKVVGSDGNYRVATSDETNTTTTLVTDAEGKIVVSGLDNGTYYLKETKTVDGYNLLSDKVKVELNISTATKWKTSSYFVQKNGVWYLVKKTETDSTTEYSGSDAATANYVTQTIVNKHGFTLPTTGGIGTLMFFIIGGVLIAGGICLITVPNKKRSV